MATRRTRSPYMMSANLGSGARTTTGGTYENPRLGIQDYTAFGRGVASTLRAPEQGEVEELQGFNTAFELGKNDFLKDIDGTTYSLEANPLVNINWQNSELAQLQNQYQKANARDRQRIQNHILGYKAAIGADENSSFSKYLKYVSDPDVYDSNVSNKFLPGVDGKNSSLTIAQFAKINSENPNAVRISSKTNRFGIPQYGFEVNGQFVNASAMTDQWLTDNFNVKADLTLDTQKSIGTGGIANVYKTVNVDRFKETDSATITLPNGEQVETTKNSTSYIMPDWFTKTDQFANTFAINRYSSENDAIYESAWNQLTNKYKDGSFKPSSQLMQRLGVEDAKEIANLRLSDQDKITLLQDQAAEEFKILNGNAGYVRGSDGRALSRNVIQYQNDTITKPIDQDDSSGSGYNSDNAFTAITTLYGEGRMAGGGGRTGTFKANEFDLDGAVKYFNDKDQKGNKFFNLYNDEAIKDLLATDDLNQKDRKQINDIIRQKSPGSKNRLIGYIDKSGNLQISKFDGTITSFINEVSAFGSFSSKEKSALRERIDEIYKKGSDIAEYSDPNDAPAPIGPITPGS